MSDLPKVQKAFKVFSEGFQQLKEAERVLSKGPASYYFEKIEGYIDALFNKFAPFKEGDRVEIHKTLNFGSGWEGSKHFLAKGCQGTVRDVDYIKGAFRADVEMDNQTWIDSQGVKNPIKKPYTFCLFETKIKLVNTK
jgi:hypothetical protein